MEFTLRPLRREGWSRAVLRARFEFWENEILTIPLRWSGLDGDRDLFSGALDTTGYLGLVWYSFQLERLDGKTLELPERQLTVYDGAAEVPAWFGEGVTYQIFPDRFRRTSIPDPTGMVGGRSVHTGWFEEPVWRPDERGEVRNRDFFGGSLAGVMEKLDYLQSLGVETLYFCPIFEGPENHRYGTGDYEKVDPMLGTNEDFSLLCAAARAKGMHVMLDGVFNHQGFVSKYFNGDGSYPGLGAHQSRESPYYPWYRFSHWPDRYESWWGIYSLPAVNEGEQSYVDYIVDSEDSIVRRWLEAGADGWRLDVADELPDEFVGKLHAAARAVKPDAVIIGEVWEDGSNKVAYGVRRKHLLGGYLDGLMNYLGTHDTVRILTLLGMGGDCGGESKEWRSSYRLTPEQRALGAARLRLASLVQYAFPGSPTTYYGDEAGMEGFEDPFNRRTFPWGGEDKDLTAWYTALGRARKELPPLRRGDIAYVKAEGAVLAFTRTWQGDSVLCAANAGDRPTNLTLEGTWVDLGGAVIAAPNHPGGPTVLRLPPMTGYLLRRL